MADPINPTVITQIGHADPNAAPLNVNELIDLLNSLISSEIQGNYIPYVVSSTAPSTEDQGSKVWLELDGAQRPISMKWWYTGGSSGAGAWRRVYNGMIGEIRGYSGNPGLTNEPTSDFDTDGHGQVSGRYDGWQLCNGKNGAPDYSNKFMIGANMANPEGTPSGYDNGWQAVIDSIAYKTGGRYKETLTLANIPVAPTEEIKVKRWKADGNTPDASSGLWGAGGTPKGGEDTIVPATDGNASPTEFWTTPPFIAYGLIIFQGY